MKHSPLGPSKMDIWVSCPGSVQFTADMPDVRSAAAVEGVVAHLVCENALKFGLEPDAVRGTTVYVTSDGRVSVRDTQGAQRVEITDEMVQGAALYVRTIRELRQDLSWGVVAPTMYIERSLSFGEDYPDIYGTADAVLVGQSKIIVADFKFGYKPVEADCNQLRLYAACALQTFDGVKRRNISEIETVVVQPRAVHEAGPVRKYCMTKDEVLQWTYNVLLPAVEATQQPNAPLLPGNHCTFCKGLSRCPAVARKVEEEALVAFASTPVVSEQEITLPPAQKMSDEQLASVLTVAPLLRTWLDAVEAEITSRLVDGRQIPGFVLGNRRTNRRWKDPVAAEQILSNLFGANAWDMKLKSPAQIEKLIKGGGDNKILDKVMDLCDAPIGEPVAVPEAKAKKAVINKKEY